MTYASALRSDASDPLAGVRARGRINVSAATRDGSSVRREVHESGALRVRFPREHFARLDATIVNVAGGMTGGDTFDLAFRAEEGASLFVSSAAAEKIYRSTGPATRIDVRLAADAGSFCAWLPQETIVFNNAHLARTLEADVAEDARFIACEMTILGRAAMNETMNALTWRERWRIRRGGQLVFADDTRMNGDAAAHLAARPIGAGAQAFATLVYLGGGAEKIGEAMRVACGESSEACEAGVSTFEDMAIARFVGRDAQATRACVTRAIAAIEGLALPRGWHT